MDAVHHDGSELYVAERPYGAGATATLLGDDARDGVVPAEGPTSHVWHLR